MLKLILFVILAVCFVSAVEIKTEYHGYTVYKIYPVTEKQKSFVKSLKIEGQYDFWTELNRFGKGIDVMIEPNQRMEFLEKMNLYDIKTEILIYDVQKLIKEDMVGHMSKAVPPNMTWTKYYKLNDIYDWMDYLAETEKDVEVITIGESFYGEPIKGIKISYRGNRGNVIIEGGTHSREWISPATVTYIINELIFSTDDRIKTIAKAFDWYIFPVTNPDGYIYSHQQVRMWSKTRTDYDVLCPGANPDRNWDFHWGEVGSSNFECNYLFRGPEVFSEKEVDSLQKFLTSLQSHTDVYLSFRNYGQNLVFPYGIASERMENHEDLYAIGEEVIKAIYNRESTEYTLGSYHELFEEEAGGIGMDWVAYNMKVPLVYTYLMRDLGGSNYLLDTKYIIPNCLEIMDSLIALFFKAEELGYFKL